MTILTVRDPAFKGDAGLSHRGFLKIGACGTAWTLADLLRVRAEQPTTARPKSVIMICLFGGPPHQDVVTIMWGEFGRTPKINNRGGRDHWDPVMSTLIAGGGLRMGQMIGSTSVRAEVPRDRPYRVPQVLSTVYRAIGIDPARTFLDGTGRPLAILEEREPVVELL